MSDSVTPWTAAHQASLFIYQTLEFIQTHVHRLDDAIQPSHPLSSPSNPAFNLSRHQGLFKWVRWPKYWVSALASVLPVNIQDWFPLGLTGWISLQSKELSRVSSNTAVQKHQFFMLSYGKATAFTRRNFVYKVMSLLFNMLSRLFITFLPRSKHLLILNHCAIHLKLTYHCKLTYFNFFFLIKRSNPLSQV